MLLRRLLFCLPFTDLMCLTDILSAVQKLAGLHFRDVSATSVRSQLMQRRHGQDKQKMIVYKFR